MRTTKRIIPFALLSGLLLSCGSEHRLARVRISQPGVREATTDTACKVPEQIAWTDDKGERHIVTRAEKDSVTGEEITSVELSEITVMARSKQAATGQAAVAPKCQTAPESAAYLSLRLQKIDRRRTGRFGRKLNEHLAHPISPAPRITCCT